MSSFTKTIVLAILSFGIITGGVLSNPSIFTTSPEVITQQEEARKKELAKWYATSDQLIECGNMCLGAAIETDEGFSGIITAIKLESYPRSKSGFRVMSIQVKPDGFNKDIMDIALTTFSRNIDFIQEW